MVYKISLAVICFLVMFASSDRASSQSSAYILRAMNFVNTEPNSIDFNIYIECTEKSVPFRFFTGQYAFNFDTPYFKGGKISFYVAPAYTGDSSDIPEEFRPRNTLISTDINDVKYIRTLSLRPFVMKEGIELKESESPETKLIRLRLSTSTDKFSDIPLNLTWRNNPDNIFTKIFLYGGSIAKDVTEPDNHLMVTEEIKNSVK